MTFKWDVCAMMAPNFLCDEEEEEINSSLVPTRSEGGGVNEFSSSALKALQSTAFKSAVNVICAAVLHGLLTGRLIGRLPSAPKLNLNLGQNLESPSAEIFNPQEEQGLNDPN